MPLENLKQGDILKTGPITVQILGICGEVYFITRPNQEEDYTEFHKGMTLIQLKNHGFVKISSKQEKEDLTVDVKPTIYKARFFRNKVDGSWIINTKNPITGIEKNISFKTREEARNYIRKIKNGDK